MHNLQNDELMCNLYMHDFWWLSKIRQNTRLLPISITLKLVNGDSSLDFGIY